MNPIKYYEFIHNNEQYIVPREWLEEHDKQIRAEEEDKRANLLAFICKKYNIPLVDMNCTVTDWEDLKEQK